MVEKHPEPKFVSDHFKTLVDEVLDIVFTLDGDIDLAKKRREEGIGSWEEAVKKRNEEMER